MQKKTFRTTIKGVASVAGVSTETISRVLNERPDVSSETRKRVKEIIKEIEPKTIMLPPSLVVRQSSLRRIISIKGGEFHPEKNARNKKEEAPAQ